MPAMRFNVMSFVFLGLALGVVGPPAGSAAAQDIDAGSELTLPVAGVPYRLSVPAGTDTVYVTYRPGSNVEIQEVLDAGGERTVSWTPLRAGVVRVTTAESSETLSVRFDRTPLPGVLVMVVAGLILFGGMVYALRKLLASDDVSPDFAADT